MGVDASASATPTCGAPHMAQLREGHMTFGRRGASGVQSGKDGERRGYRTALAGRSLEYEPSDDGGYATVGAKISRRS